MRFSILVVLGLSLLTTAGCSTLKRDSAPQELTISRMWAKDTLAAEHLRYRWMHRMTPLVLEKIIVQGNGIDGLAAYDRGTGMERWRLPIENGVEGGATAAGDRIYFGGNDGQFYCVEFATGKIIWTFPARSETLAPPTVAGNMVYFQTGADTLIALDAISGKQLWFYNRQTASPIMIRATTRPVVDGDLLYAGFSDGYLVAFKKNDGSLTWERKLNNNPRFRDVDSTPVFDEQRIYVASYDGQLYALRKDSGETVWQVEHGSYTPVTLVGERLFYATTDGHVMALDRASGKVLWVRAVKNGIATQPNHYKGYLVYGESDGPLVVIDADKGEFVTQFNPGRGLLAMPYVNEATGDTYFISNNAILWAMKLKMQGAMERLPWEKRGI